MRSLPSTVNNVMKRPIHSGGKSVCELEGELPLCVFNLQVTRH